VGRSLLSTDFEAREIFMAASYSSYAIIGPEEIVSIDSLGRYSVLDPDYREIRNARLPDWARAATRLLFEFYSARDLTSGGRQPPGFPSGGWLIYQHERVPLSTSDQRAPTRASENFSGIPRALRDRRARRASSHISSSSRWA